MIPHKKSNGWIAVVVLTTVALACSLPSGQEETATPTFTPEPTLPVLETVITAPDDCTATANQDLNMRTGPGKAWPTVSQLAGGNSAKVTGHNGDKSWWQLNGSAWVSAPLTTLSGECTEIQVVGFPPPPQADNPAEEEEPTQEQAPNNPPPATQAPQPTQVPPNLPQVNLAFEVDYSITWFCGNDWRVSFIVYNQGNVNIESVYYSVEAPTGHYLNDGTTNDSPFEATAKESQPACAQAAGHGQSSLAPGNSGYVPINLSPLGAGVTEGFLYFEACTQNNRAGVCESQILYFTFTT